MFSHTGVVLTLMIFGLSLMSAGVSTVWGQTQTANNINNEEMTNNNTTPAVNTTILIINITEDIYNMTTTTLPQSLLNESGPATVGAGVTTVPNPDIFTALNSLNTENLITTLSHGSNMTSQQQTTATGNTPTTTAVPPATTANNQRNSTATLMIFSANNSSSSTTTMGINDTNVNTTVAPTTTEMSVSNTSQPGINSENSTQPGINTENSTQSRINAEDSTPKIEIDINDVWSVGDIWSGSYTYKDDISYPCYIQIKEILDSGHFVISFISDVKIIETHGDFDDRDASLILYPSESETLPAPFNETNWFLDGDITETEAGSYQYAGEMNGNSFGDFIFQPGMLVSTSEGTADVTEKPVVTRSDVAHQYELLVVGVSVPFILAIIVIATIYIIKRRKKTSMGKLHSTSFTNPLYDVESNSLELVM